MCKIFFIFENGEVKSEFLFVTFCEFPTTALLEFKLKTESQTISIIIVIPAEIPKAIFFLFELAFVEVFVFYQKSFYFCAKTIISPSLSAKSFGFMVSFSSG